MEKALEKQKSKKDKGKKSKKNDDSSKGDDYMNKKKKDGNSKSRTSTLKKIANSFNPSGPPPEPPARPAPKEQNISEEPERPPSTPGLPGVPVMSDLIKELGNKSGTLKKTSDNVKASSGTPQKVDEPPRFTASNVQQRPPAPLPSDHHHQQQQQQAQQGQSKRPLLPPGHENGIKHVPATSSHTPRKPLPTLHGQNKPLPAPPRHVLQKSLSYPSPPPANNKQDTTSPTDEEEQDIQSPKRPKPAKGEVRPSPGRTKSSDSVNTEGGKPRSPVARPRNRPPPPPPPGQLTAKSTSNSSLSSSDTNVSEPSSDSQGPSPRPRPVPRPRQRADQDHSTSTRESGKGVASSRPMSPPGTMSNVSRQPSLKSRPAHPPPAIPDITKKPSGGSNASQQSAPGTKLKSTGPRPSPVGPKPKPLVKPNMPRRPKLTPPSLQPDPRLSPQVNEILKLSNQGQAKVKEVLSLTDARVMDDSNYNLLEVISELQKISLQVLESSSSLTDSLGPQARFRVRQTVTDLKSKYSDMEGVIQTVGPNPNVVDMERIGKVVHSFSGALDSICNTVRATAS